MLVLRLALVLGLARVRVSIGARVVVGVSVGARVRVS